MTWIALAAIIGWSVSTIGWWYCLWMARHERAKRLAQQQRIDAAAEGLTRPERRLVKP